MFGPYGDPADLLAILLLLVAIAGSFTVSAAAGLGGSLVLVPALTIALGPKEGVALAAMLLGMNNVLKAFVYRDVLPYRASVLVVACTMVGAFLGASLLVAVPESIVGTAVVASLVFALVAERAGLNRLQRSSAPVLAFASGSTSGFSGTSGPLKGVAIKSLRLDYMHTVGAATLVSLAGDLAKVTVFADAGLLGGTAWRIAVLATPLMVVGTYGGRRLNLWLGERRWAVLFWIVMSGYAVRLFAP